ncbi:MAG TPA: CoA-binding protein [Dehalococcoidia bacterium]
MGGLDALFKPRSVAVVGASPDPAKLGYVLLSNLLRHRFPGPVYPISLRHDTVLHLKAYRSVLDVPGPVDLVLVSIPAPGVAAVLEECGRKGVQAAVVISAGFREVGPEGQAREEEVRRVAARYGIRLLGPNCLGVIDTFHSLDASFAEGMPARWEVAVMSQSGAMGTAILDWSLWRGLGFSKFVSLGNMADVDAVDLLEYWRDDPQSRVIVGYLEGVGEGRRFMEVARTITRHKPVILMVVGTTALGAAAVSSHTGSLASTERVVDAALRQVGVVRALIMEEMFDFSLCFSYSPLPAGRNVAVVTNAGGPGVMTADAIERLGLRLAPLEQGTRERLRAALPPAASARNPIDLLGDAGSDRYQVALEAICQDATVHGVIVLLTPQAVTEPERTARVISNAAKLYEKPIFAVYMGGVAVSRGRDMLADAQVPVYFYPERAVRSLQAMVQYAEYRAALTEAERLREPAQPGG